MMKVIFGCRPTAEMLVLHSQLEDVWRSPYPVLLTLYIMIQKVDPWRGINAMSLMKSSKSFHTFAQSFQPPSGGSMWQPTENSLCKINSFQHVAHAKQPPVLQLPANVGISYHTNRSIVLCDERTHSYAVTYGTPSARLILHHDMQQNRCGFISDIRSHAWL